jgi:hypothetical protein
MHDAVPPGLRLRLEPERGPRLEREIEDGQEPFREQYGSVSARQTFSGK